MQGIRVQKVDATVWETMQAEDAYAKLQEACGNWHGGTLPPEAYPEEREKNQYVWLTIQEILGRVDNTFEVKLRRLLSMEIVACKRCSGGIDRWRPKNYQKVAEASTVPPRRIKGSIVPHGSIME